MAEAILEPSVGLLTFRAEGDKGGLWNSLVFQVPDMMSGLTIGRGYDMSLRTKAHVRSDLTNAGLDAGRAAQISGGAGLIGSEAETFLTDNNLRKFKITGQQQLNLFNLDYPRFVTDTKYVANLPAVTKRYGATDWGALNPTIEEVLVDLRYRGDYTPDSRMFLQKTVAGNDLSAFCAAIGKRSNWPYVPEDRFRLRAAWCDGEKGN